MSIKVAFVLSDQAQKIISDNATERARGEWVSAVIVAWERERALEGVGALERVEARVIRLRDVLEARR